MYANAHANGFSPGSDPDQADTMAEQFANKTVVVTGASAGVGAATARAFAAAGANLVLAARSEDKLESLANELGGIAVVADITQSRAIQTLVETAVETYGGLDVLVNNAGCNNRGPVASLEANQLAQMIDTNLRAPVLLTRAALPHLQASRGAVVNVASLAGQMPLPDEATYSASKFGLRAFTYALSGELEGSGVSASVVSPGPIETGFILDDADNVPDVVFSQPMSTAEDIAGLIVACAGDGRIERSKPQLSHVTATLGYLFPRLPKLLQPILRRKGQRTKQRYLGSTRE